MHRLTSCSISGRSEPIFEKESTQLHIARSAETNPSEGATMTMDGSKNRWLAVALGLVAGIALAGCATTSAEQRPTQEAESSASGPASPGAETAPLPPSPVVPTEQSILRIRQPGNRVAAGTRVVLGGSTIQVTATSATHVWIQEAGGDGRCEVGDDVVAYRAIEVSPSGAIPRLARGQRVEVEGTVTDVDGHRVLTDATVKPIGAPGEPYVAHCQRDGSKLAEDALDAVLVITAGSTESVEPPGADGAWSLTPCFGTSAPSIAIGAEMAGNPEWSPSWYWVTGVITRHASVLALEPRDTDDIVVRHSNDACL
jgi:hypothetical protein